MKNTFQQQCKQLKNKLFNVALTVPNASVQAFNKQLNAALKNGESFAEFQQRLLKETKL